MSKNVLRGRLIAEIIPCNYSTPSGLLIVDRKNVSSRGKVLAIGKESMSVNSKAILPPCKAGDIVYYKKYKPMYHDYSKDGMQKGTCTIWWEDILAILDNSIIKATYDNVIVKCIYQQVYEKIVVPDKFKKRNQEFHGEVVAAGPKNPFDLKPGDKILFPRNEGFSIIVDEIEYLCLQERRILAILGDDE